MVNSLIVGGVYEEKDADITCCEKETIPWRDIISKKVKKKYPKVIVQDVRAFWGIDTVDPKKINSIMNLCDSKILIRKSDDGDRLSASFLSSQCPRFELSNEYDDIYYVLNKLKPRSKTVATASLPNTIDRDFFLSKIEDTTFISDFCSSLNSLMQAKIDFYKSQIQKYKIECGRIREKEKKIRELKGCDLKEKSSLLDTYATAIMDMEELIEIIRENKKAISPNRTKYNLMNVITNTHKGLDSIVGREDVKNIVYKQLYAFSKSFKIFFGSFHNYCLMGKSGVGKTAIAKVLSFVYSECGILATNSVYVVTKSDIVAGYIGQTAMKTKEVLFKSLEGILFIDEAYQLISKKGDYSHEAIAEVVNFLDKFIGMNIVIVAGYEREMKKDFFQMNEGLSRRFPKKITLKDYNQDELCSILMDELLETLEETFIEEVKRSFATFYKPKLFPNQAGDVMLLADRISENVLCFGIQGIQEGYKEYVIEKGCF